MTIFNVDILILDIIGEVIMQIVAIHELKARLSEYLKRMFEENEPVFITKHGKVVAKITLSNRKEAWEVKRKRLAGSLLFYKDPTESVGMEDWEVLDDNP